MGEQYDAQLIAGGQQLGLNLKPALIAQLTGYLNHLVRWNQAHNLIAHCSYATMIDRHILDSLSVVDYLDDSDTVLDVGTGAGLPGIPLAILCPDIQFYLLDKSHKKTIFLRYVCAEIGLKNVHVICSRSENYISETGYSIIITRALTTLRQMIECTHHLLKDSGQWLAMKGQYPEKEVNNLPHGIALSVASLIVPQTLGKRCLITMKAFNELPAVIKSPVMR